MESASWALVVILLMADGSGGAALLDKETGRPALFETEIACVTELTIIRDQVVGNPMFDIERSTLECIEVPVVEE